MTVKEVLGSLGSWSVRLKETVPEEVRAKFDFFEHVAILRGTVDLSLHSGPDLLSSARYVGVVRDIDLDESRELSGAGMVLWLGDEDEKGAVFESKVALTNATLATCVATLMPSSLAVGTVHPQPDPAQRFTGSFQFVTPRTALQEVCDAFGVESRVNGNGSVDVGTQADLYTSIPDSIVVRRGAGVDMETVAIGARFDVEKSGVDYSDRVLLVGQTQENATFAVGAASAPVVPYRDLLGNQIKRTRMISESGTTSGTVAQRSQLHLNRYNRTKTALKVTAEDYEIEGNFRVGDLTDVYDPDTGIVNSTRERYFRGEVLHPDLIRVSEISWSITDDHTVAYRTKTGEWIDLTPWVEFETGTNEIVVGDLPRSITSPRSNPVLDRADALPDSSVPNAPTDLQLSTTSFVGPTGVNGALILAEWTAPTANTDGTALVDLDHYRVQYRPAFRAPLWDTRVSATPEIDLPVTVDLVYDVRVAAVDKVGNVSAYTPTVSITASKDQTAPAVPSDPSVTSYLGQLRIEWDGLTSTGGAMPPDLNRVDVHVSTSAGFTPSSATLIASLSTKGVAYATAPYGEARYVRLVAVDHTGNSSAASGTITGSTVRVNDGDVQALSVGKLTAGIMTADVTIAGRFATALTGARVEVNALGLQKWDSANNLLVSITGTEALLTGKYRSSVTGRRIEMGSAGLLGELNFYAPDGKQSFLRAYTESAGLEAIQEGVNLAETTPYLSSALINQNSDGWTSYWAHKHQFTYASSDTAGSKTDGYLTVFERNHSTGSSTQRLRIGKNGKFDYIKAPGTDDFTIWERTGDSFFRRMFITDTDVWFPWDRTDQGRILLRPGQAAGDVAAGVQMVNRHNFGGTIFAAADVNGNNHRFEIKNATSTSYIPAWASAFTVSSSETGKTDILDIGPGALQKLRPLKVKSFRRRGHENVAGAPGPSGPVEVGLIAEELPDEMRVDVLGSGAMWDLGPTIALLLAAMQELAGEVDELKKGPRP